MAKELKHLGLVPQTERDDSAQPASVELVDEAPASALMTIEGAALVEINAVEAGLAALRAKHAGKTYDLSTGAGMEEAKQDRLAIRNVRYRLPHLVKEKKAEMKRVAGAMEAEAERITSELLAMEEPIDAQIKAEETRKEAEREAKRRAKAEQDAKVQEAIDAIRARVTMAAGQSAETIAELLTVADAFEPQSGDFAERLGDVLRAKSETVTALRDMHAKAVEWERTQAELRERARVDAIRADIENTFARAALGAIGQSSQAIEQAICGLFAVTVTVERFAEFAEDASAARVRAMAQLVALKSAAMASEAAETTAAQAQRVADDAARLEQQRQQQEAQAAELQRQQEATARAQQEVASQRAQQIAESIEAIRASVAGYNAESSMADLTAALQMLRGQRLSVAAFGSRINDARLVQSEEVNRLEIALFAAIGREAAAVEPAAPAAPAPAPAPMQAPEPATNQATPKAPSLYPALAAFVALEKTTLGVVDLDGQITEWADLPAYQAAVEALRAVDDLDQVPF